jgi:hypothetical protein
MEEHLDINKKKLDRKDVVRKKAMRFHTVKKKKKAKGKINESTAQDIVDEEEEFDEN